MIKRFFLKLRDLLGSLRIRLLVVLFLAITLAVGVYFFCRGTSLGYIDTVYASEENKKEREREFIKDLQNYIKANDISSEQTAKISKWAEKNRYVYLLMYKNDELFYTSDDKVEEPDEEIPPTPPEQTPDTENPPDDTENPEDAENSEGEGKGEDSEEPGGVTVVYPTREELFEYAKKNDLYPIEVSDGTIFASIAEYTDYIYRDIANIMSFVVAACTVILIMMIYIHRVTGRIIHLGNDVNLVAEGDMEHKISLDGHDEISKLSVNVENMRSSMIENIRKEREAFDSNAELITSMSHDIRTPLTVLLGYIDIMRDRAGDDDIMQSYIKAAESTAMRLKKLSDDMFGYFLVFGGSEVELSFESYHAQTLILQMLSEHIFLMCESGYTVESSELYENIPQDCNITTDANKLLRIFDNIFSNIYKYADKEKTVDISVENSESYIKISFCNAISKDTANVESNGIGLKTCKKLAEITNAIFEYGEDNDSFFVSVSLRKDKI